MTGKPLECGTESYDYVGLVVRIIHIYIDKNISQSDVEYKYV